MCEEGHSRVGHHADQGGREAAIEVHEAGVRGRGDCCCCCRDNGDRRGGGRLGWMFMVDLTANLGQRGARIAFGFEGESHADYFQGVGDEDGGQAREGSAGEAAQRGFVGGGWDDDMADLLVGEEFDGCVGEDLQEGSRVSPEEAAHAVLPVDVAHGRHDAKP